MRETECFKPGDIILSNRGIYKHYGVYAGNGRVIHYSSSNGDFGLDICVRETSLKQFAHGWGCSVVELPDNHDRENHFSREETVHRARSRLGEEEYNLIFNNCEHFAFWCKTGKHKSAQVENAITGAAILGAALFVTKLVIDSDSIL